VALAVSITGGILLLLLQQKTFFACQQQKTEDLTRRTAAESDAELTFASRDC
jgi:hypothetical protein